MHKPSALLAANPAWNQKSIQELGSAQGKRARARDGSAHEGQNRWLAVVFLGFAMVLPSLPNVGRHGRLSLLNILILFKRPPERISKPKKLARCNLPWQMVWLHATQPAGCHDLPGLGFPAPLRWWAPSASPFEWRRPVPRNPGHCRSKGRVLETCL